MITATTTTTTNNNNSNSDDNSNDTNASPGSCPSSAPARRARWAAASGRSATAHWRGSAGGRACGPDMYIYIYIYIYTYTYICIFIKLP